jgi:hypothetical protein
MKLEIPLRVPRINPKLNTRKLTAPYWNLVRLHGGSRKKMVDFICNIGGYYADRGERFAIEFNISADKANLDYDHLLSRYRDGDADNVIPTDPAHAAIYERCFKEAYDEAGNNLWVSACEDAYQSWSDSDTPYENWTGVRIKWQWDVRGRSGKHLCMTECAGIDLKRREEDLRETLMERESLSITSPFCVAAEDVVKLFIVCVMNTVEITRESIGKEVEFQALWLLARNAEAEAEPLCEEYDERESLKEPASTIRELLSGYAQSRPELAAAMDKICKLAGVEYQS